MRLISDCELQRCEPHHFRGEAKDDPDALVITGTNAGSSSAADGSMRTADGSTAEAPKGQWTGSELIPRAGENLAGDAEACHPRTCMPLTWSTHVESRCLHAGFGPSRMTMNLSSGRRETKDYAGAAALLNTALTALQRTRGGAASHSTTTTTAEALLAQAQHELREQLHGSPHARKP